MYTLDLLHARELSQGDWTNMRGLMKKKSPTYVVNIKNEQCVTKDGNCPPLSVASLVDYSPYSFMTFRYM